MQLSAITVATFHGHRADPYWCACRLPAGFIPNEQQGSFLRSWLDSHLQAAQTINKPLLFEEFGKKLDPGAGPDVISKLRDPVYAASYEAVETAVENNKPLLGSLYWKWAVPGLEGGKGET